MSLSNRDFSSLLLSLYWNSRVCLATVRNCSSLKSLCIRQTSLKNDLWASLKAWYSPNDKVDERYFSVHDIVLFFYQIGPDPPSSTLPGSWSYSFYSIPPSSHLEVRDLEILPKPRKVWKWNIFFIYLFIIYFIYRPLTSGSGSIIPSIPPSLLISNSNPVLIQLLSNWGYSESTNLSSSAPDNSCI